jgi:hypothetical protein
MHAPVRHQQQRPAQPAPRLRLLQCGLPWPPIYLCIGGINLQLLAANHPQLVHCETTPQRRFLPALCHAPESGSRPARRAVPKGRAAQRSGLDAGGGAWHHPTAPPTHLTPQTHRSHPYNPKEGHIRSYHTTTTGTALSTTTRADQRQTIVDKVLSYDTYSTIIRPEPPPAPAEGSDSRQQGLEA